MTTPRLRKKILKSLHQTGDDLVAKAIDSHLNVVREQGKCDSIHPRKK